MASEHERTKEEVSAELDEWKQNLYKHAKYLDLAFTANGLVCLEPEFLYLVYDPSDLEVISRQEVKEVCIDAIRQLREAREQQALFHTQNYSFYTSADILYTSKKSIDNMINYVNYSYASTSPYDQFRIAQLYAKGDGRGNQKGIALNYETAKEWYEKAANNGLAIAQYCLASMHHPSPTNDLAKYGIVQSYHLAIAWYVFYNDFYFFIKFGLTNLFLCLLQSNYCNEGTKNVHVKIGGSQ